MRKRRNKLIPTLKTDNYDLNRTSVVFFKVKKKRCFSLIFARLYNIIQSMI